MSTTTIDIRIDLGGQVYHLEEVGDPDDALFAAQVGRSVSMALLGHREVTHEGAVPRTPGDGVTCDVEGCDQPVFYWRKATCACEMNVCYTHHRRQSEAGAFWCWAHRSRAQWFLERYLR